MNGKRTLIGIVCFAAYLVLIALLALGLHFTGARLVLFCAILGALGLLALVATLWYINRVNAGGGGAADSSPDIIHLRALMRDADRRIHQAGRPGVKSLSALPLLYVIGDQNSAKTQTVLRSGLDPELLAGAVYQDQQVAATQLVNLWLAGNWAIAESGGAMLQQQPLWMQFIKGTRPARLGSVFSKNSRLPARIALVCVSVERILAPNTIEQIRTLAQELNQKLRQLSQTLGVALPVYVLFTKLDRIGSFSEYANRLTEEEVQLPVGSLLPALEANSGVYSEAAAAAIAEQFDQLVFALSEFRVEALSRGGELPELARAYEFPRDLRKLRQGMISFLVELARPSQIGVNPFLRGFFYSGMRAHFVQSVLDVGLASARPQRALNTDATQAFSFSTLQNQPAERQSQSPAMRKEPQWVFLPQLISRTVLADTLALEASRESVRTDLLRRTLLGCTAAGMMILLALTTISFVNNRNLAQRVSSTAILPVMTPATGALAAREDLENLEKLRVVLDLLEQNHRDGAPKLYRMGLYSGDDLMPYTCQAYTAKFRALLLTPTQAAIVSRLGSLPAAPAKDDSYTATYWPLKAYVLTVSNPNPDSAQDTTDFLPSALLAAWSGAASPDPAVAQLARRQFEFYAAHLATPASCMAAAGGARNDTVINQARTYLSGFEGFQHVYQSMLAGANRHSNSFSFNSRFPGSSQFILDNYTVQGAFTKQGFAFMQDAILHPDAYVGGEQWVLGPSSSGSVDRVTLAAQLKAAFTADFLQTWRTYLHTAQFSGYENLHDAADKLSAFDGPSSPVLELLSLAAINTRVAQPDLAQAFQAPQSMVPDSSQDARLITPANQPYIQALQGIEAAVKGVLANPMSANDPSAYGPIGQAAVNADQAAKAASIGFIPDRTGNVDKTTLAILEAPIEAAESLAAQAPARAAGGAAKGFCAQIAPLMTKFPFNPQSTIEATPDEVEQVFAPGQGSFAQFYNASIRSLAVQQGTQFIPAPGSAVKINPAFLSFLGKAQTISNAMFPAGGSQPGLDFTLTEVKTSGAAGASLSIDGKRLKGPGQPQSFHWSSQAESSITLATAQDTRSFTRSWAVFHFAYAAIEPAPNQLRFSFSLNNQVPEVLIFDVSGPGAPLLNADFMRSFHCVSAVGR